MDRVAITGISPDSGIPGDTFDMTIIGTGFADGMQVALDNGDSYTPMVTNVVVNGLTQITATITIKDKGRSKSDNVWDLHVGSAILPDAFTVKQ